MDSYTAKPSDVFYPVLLLVLGCWSFFQGSVALKYLGVGLWIIAAVLLAWIVIVGIWAERARYYDSVAEALEASSKTDLVKMAALGFKPDDLPQSVHIDLHEGTRSRHFSLPVPAVKLRPFATALLNGQPFTERRWTGKDGLLSVAEFRAMRAVMLERGLIEPANDKDNRQGFNLTLTGRTLMRELAPSPPLSLDMA